MRRLVPLLFAIACGPARMASPVTAKPLPPPPPQKPPQLVVVTLVVDQFAAWMAEERLGELPDNGGFARLRREGTWAVSMRYAHAVTDTAPGHSSLYTALPPRMTNIFANEMLDPKTGTQTSILRDPKEDLVTALGNAEGFGVSLAALADVETIADRLHAEKPNASIVSMSLKDRGALFGCGRHPDACIWYEWRGGGFVSSTAFTKTLPKWLPDQRTLAEAAQDPWVLEDEAWIKAHARTPDDQAGEGEANGLGNTFPHKAPAQTKAPLQALRYTPMADRILLQAGIASLSEQTKGEPMLLAISLSTFDYVGHVWGPDSWESWDELRRLDGALAQFFRALDDKLGEDGWAIVVSADHGITSMPEVGDNAHPWCKPGTAPDPYERACGAVTRVIPAQLADELESVAQKAIGKGDWILGVADPYVYYTYDALVLSKDKRDALDRALVDAIRARPEVARVVRSNAIPETCTGDELDIEICQSLSKKTPEALYVVLKPGSFFDSGHALGKGASHGSPYLFDRSVPLLVRAKGRVPAGKVLRDPISFESFARTTCSLLGIKPMPAAASGRDLAAPSL